MEYKRIICGGTFDRLHDAHKAFLRFAFSHGENVIIGVTSDMYVKQFKSMQGILPFRVRKKELEAFLSEEHLLQRATIVSIDNKFDQTQVPEGDSVALLVSEETYASGLEINKEREKNNRLPLKLLVFPTMYEETGEKISSTVMRKNLEDLLNKEVFSIPEYLRENLRKPFGIVYSENIPQEKIRDWSKIVVVGDATTKKFHNLGVLPKLSVIDFRIERKHTNETLESMGFSGKENIFSVANMPGTLQPAVWSILKKAISKKGENVVVVDGEEDLLVIPLVLLLPEGFSLFYGQPGEGLVFLEITKTLKERVEYLLEQFDHK